MQEQPYLLLPNNFDSLKTLRHRGDPQDDTRKPERSRAGLTYAIRSDNYWLHGGQCVRFGALALLPRLTVFFSISRS
jgi:hypothetical protein